MASSSRPLTRPTGTTVIWASRPWRVARPNSTPDCGEASLTASTSEAGTMTATLPVPTASSSSSAAATTSASRRSALRPGGCGAGRRPRGSSGAARGRGRRRQHAGGQGHVRRRQPVADGELGPPRLAPVGQVVEDLLPVGVGPLAGGLGDVADDGHRPVERAAVEHPQLHRARGPGPRRPRCGRRCARRRRRRRPAPAARGLGPSRARASSSSGTSSLVHTTSSSVVDPRAVRAPPSRPRTSCVPAGVAQQRPRAEQVVQQLRRA